MVSQNILNLIDTAMVGSLGNVSLAAVGYAGFLTFVATSFVTGLSTGVQAMASRRMGEGREDVMAIPLNGGILLGLGLALPLMGVLYFLAPMIFDGLVTDQQVVEVGSPYLQVRMLGIAAVGLNFVFRGYWNGVNLSRLYMRTLVVMHIVNIALNYILIFGKFGAPELGALGAGIGTVVSLYVGTLYYLIQAAYYARDAGFARGLPDRETIKTMLRLAIPSGLQNFFFAAVLSAFFSIVENIGTPQLAASQVLVSLLLVGLLPGIGFGLAAASLVGQSLGTGDTEDAVLWGWDVMKLAMIVVGTLSIPALVAPDLLLSGFLHDPETLEMARLPLRLLAGMLFLDIGGLVLMNALLGAGDVRRVAFVSIALQWLLMLPAAYFFGVSMGGGLVVVWICQMAYRALQGAIFAGIWRSRTWVGLKV